jgi:hypothetical protein
MKHFMLSGLAFGMAALMCVGQSQAVHVNVQFDNSAGNGNFTEAANWADDTAPAANNKIYIIENGLTADLTGTTASVAGITTGDAGVGTLIVDGGTLNVTTDVTIFGTTGNAGGFPTGFHVGGHQANHTGNGTVNIINSGRVNVIRDPDAPAANQGRDTGFIGERADGIVNIGPGSLLDSPEIIWRIGQFGGFFGADEYSAVGIVNIQGTFNADIIFASANGGDSEFNLSGNGRLFTAREFRAESFDHRLSANTVIRMTGSNVTWDSDDIRLSRAVSGPDVQPRPHVIFTADAAGVSPMVARDALLFNDAEVTVDLTAFTLNPTQQIRLFDARPGQLADGHAFGVLNVIGGPAGATYRLVYDDDATGDIFLRRQVPEPATVVLLLLGFLSLALGRRRNIQ